MTGVGTATMWNFDPVIKGLPVQYLGAAEALADFACQQFIFHGTDAAILEQRKSLIMTEPCLRKTPVCGQVRNQAVIVYRNLASPQGNINKCIVQMVVVQVDLLKRGLLALPPYPVNIRQ